MWLKHKGRSEDVRVRQQRWSMTWGWVSKGEARREAK